MSGQADGHTLRPREDLTEGTALWWAQPVAADCSPGGCFCLGCSLPASVPVPSFLVAQMSACGRHRCLRAELQGHQGAPQQQAHGWKNGFLLFRLIPVKNLAVLHKNLELWLFSKNEEIWQHWVHIPTWRQPAPVRQQLPSSEGVQAPGLQASLALRQLAALTSNDPVPTSTRGPRGQ